MKLYEPFKISPRLLPALHIGGAWVNLEYAGEIGGRTVYLYTIDLPDGSEYSGKDLKSGVGGGNLQSGFASLLAFLGAAAEGGEHEDLFPAPVTEWAAQNQDEIGLLQVEIDESEKPLIKE